MAGYDFAAQLDQYGPRRQSGPVSLDDARAYCSRLARTHYENFSVASSLVPARLRQHFANIYAYCRWADDLADETGDSAASLELLDWWRGQLEDCFRGRAEHPVFVALTQSIEDFDIPREPFWDLLSAFRQDQRKTRYETEDELLDYCRRSANPVGRLVLRLGRCDDDENVQLSDCICTGLQRINFCQDVRRDFERGRIYLPRESWRKFNIAESDFSVDRANASFRELIAHEVDRAESHLVQGQPLVERAAPDLRMPIDLFVRGGLALVRGVRNIHYDVLRRRPIVGRWTKLRLIAGAWWRHRRGGAR